MFYKNKNKKYENYNINTETNDNTLNRPSLPVTRISIDLRDINTIIKNDIKLISKTKINKLEKEIKSLKELITKYKEEIDNLNGELDQYENEAKVMDKELKTQKQKIEELTIETGQSKDISCLLLKSVIQKKLMKYQIDMILGIYRKEIDKLIENEKLLKKKIADLTAELHMFKYGKKMPSNLEEYQNDLNVEEKENMAQSEGENEKQIQKYEGKNGVTRVVDVGTTTKQIGNTVVTTKTTKISYKRRRVGNNQQ